MNNLKKLSIALTISSISLSYAQSQSNDVIGYVNGKTIYDNYCYREDSNCLESMNSISGTNVNASNNNIEIFSGFFGDILGGRTFQGYSKNNEVIISGGNVKHFVMGGFLTEGEVTENKVSVTNGTIRFGVSGGSVDLGDAKNNTVIISGGNVSNVGTFSSIGKKVFVAGGEVGEGNASENKVLITGGTIEDDILSSAVVAGGSVYKGSATNNTVTYAGGEIKGSIYGGYLLNELDSTAKAGDLFSGNTLNIGESATNPVKMNRLKAENIANFENINFYLPSTVKHGDTALELTTNEKTDLSKSTVSAYLENATNLTKDSKINLIKTAGTLNSPKDTNTSGVKVDIAGLINVKGNIALDDSSKLLQLGFDGDTKPADPTPADPTPADPTPADPTPADPTPADPTPADPTPADPTPADPTPADPTPADPTPADPTPADPTPADPTPADPTPTDPAIVAPAVIPAIISSTEGRNSKSILESQLVGVSMIEQGGDFAIDNLANSKVNKVGDATVGVYPFVNVGGFNKKVKTGSHIEVKGGNLNLGVGADNGNLNSAFFVEYGKGNWDSHLDNGFNDSGKSHYYGAGLFGQFNTQSGFYTEGSLRGGKVKTKSDEGIYKYDLSSGYFGAHAGLGQKINAGNNELDIYGKYYYLHTGSDKFNLKGVDVNVDSVNSNRVKLGIKDTINFDDNNALYAGVAYQYAFDGKSKGTVSAVGQSAEIASPKLKGSTGIGELGYQYSNNGFDFSIGAKGYAGKERGFGADAKVKYNFK